MTATPPSESSAPEPESDGATAPGPEGAAPRSAGRSVSVIIATRDRPEMLQRALAGVTAQEHDGPLEVIVVYDRTDPDPALTLDHPRFTLRVMTNQRAGGLAG
ncbi:MAG: glycosyl transferase family 2, partial [Acidimicrobiales bacterium]